MHNRYLIIAVFISVMVASSSLKATELWRGTQAGESQSSILSKISSATVNPDPGTISSGATCRVHIESLNVASYPFRAVFFFGKQTQQVPSLISAKGSLGQGIFEALEALRSKYKEDN